MTYVLPNMEVLFEETIPSTNKIQKPNYTFDGYLFDGWYYNGTLFTFDKYIENDITLVAGIRDSVTISFELGPNIFRSKEELRYAFYKDFYNFILNKGTFDFSSINVTNYDDFLAFCLNWNASDKSDLYGVGNAFSSYFLTIEEDGLLENQPDDTFIGWCYKNNRYVGFIKHLITFFAYWRTDEGYTTADNHGNDFFFSSWAALVDTAKFFYFTSDTLNDKYPWFKSERVKDALDNIPVVITFPKQKVMKYNDILSEIVIPGYTFIGWYSEDTYENKIDKAIKDLKVYLLIQ